MENHITVRVPRWAHELADRLRHRVLDGELPSSLRKRLRDELGNGAQLGLGVVIGLSLLALEKRMDSHKEARRGRVSETARDDSGDRNGQE